MAAVRPQSCLPQKHGIQKASKVQLLRIAVLSNISFMLSKAWPDAKHICQPAREQRCPAVEKRLHLHNCRFHDYASTCSNRPHYVFLLCTLKWTAPYNVLMQALTLAYVVCVGIESNMGAHVCQKGLCKISQNQAPPRDKLYFKVKETEKLKSVGQSSQVSQRRLTGLSQYGIETSFDQFNEYQTLYSGKD